jgi:hypothetical protein
VDAAVGAAGELKGDHSMNGPSVASIIQPRWPKPVDVRGALDAAVITEAVDGWKRVNGSLPFSR